MELQEILIISLLCAPMLGLVIWAFATMHPRFSTTKILFLQNRAVAFGVITICLVALTVLIAWQAYEMGRCHNGLLSPAKCSNLPDKIGGYLFNIHFLGAIFLVAICLPALLMMGIAEFITRRKLQTSLTKDAAG